MASDPYRECPCGSGKKIKFCCCNDLTHEMDRIFRAIEGDQRVSALDQVNKLIDAKGSRPALRALKIDLLLTLGNFPEAEKETDQLLKAVPNSCVGFATKAILDSLQGNLESAMEHLQEACENCDNKITPAIYSAVSLMAARFFERGKPFVAKALLQMQASWTNGDDVKVLERLAELNGTPNLPLVLKDDFAFPQCPADAKWKGEFEAATKSAFRGAWLAACESLESLNEKVPNQPCIWHGIAILRARLGHDDLSVAAWRKYASLPGVSRDDAVEAEAISLLLSPPGRDDTIDRLVRTYTVRDMDRLMETLLSNKQFFPMEHDLAELSEEGQPPPKAAFHLLDRTGMDTSDQIHSLSDLPVVHGEVVLFGRQTDRDARLELHVDRRPEYEKSCTGLLERMNEHLGPVEKEEVVGKLPRMRSEMNVRYRYPRDASMERIKQWMSEHRRLMYFERWPQVPQSSLNGKTAAEAAQDEALKNRVLGAILNMESAFDDQSTGEAVDFNELRRQLNLPERGETNLDQQSIAVMSPVRMAKLNFESLSDDDLNFAFRRAVFVHHRVSMFRSAKEIVQRPSMSQKLDFGDLYQTLVAASPTADNALHYIEQGRKHSESHKESPARWLLLELRLRILRGEAVESQQLLRTITSRHVNEPGVAEGLRSLLVELGIINPDGTPRAQAAAGMTEGAPAQAPAEEPSALWTPNTPAAAPQSESKLWLPGNS